MGLFRARSVSAFLVLFSFLILLPRMVSANDRVRSQKKVVVADSVPMSRFTIGTGIAVLEGVEGGSIGLGGNIGFAFRVSETSPV